MTYLDTKLVSWYVRISTDKRFVRYKFATGLLSTCLFKCQNIYSLDPENVLFGTETKKQHWLFVRYGSVVVTAQL